MNIAEELKKYKELLDDGIITQDEFDKKKRELLAGDINEPSAATKSGDKQSDMKQKKVHNQKGLLKKIVIVFCIIAVVAMGWVAGKRIVENIQHTKRAAALEAGIASIMAEYGLDTYTVKYVDYEYDVYAEGFESLTNGEALACLKALDGVSVDDPCGDGEIEFFMTNVHPGLDVDYSYWRVSSGLVYVNQTHGGGYTTPGIYCNRYGNNTCVYACES